MDILIIDTGIYKVDSDIYYEAFHIADLLKNKFNVDIFKDRILDKPDGANVKTFDEIIHKKYEMIISLNPSDFEYIIKYKKFSKYSPLIVFEDRFDFIDYLYNNKRNLFTKNFMKIIQNIAVYIGITEKIVNKARRVLSGIDIEYLPPYISEKHFAENKNNNYEFEILFSSILDRKKSDLDTLIKAVKFISKSDFAERNNFTIDIFSNGIDCDYLKKQISKNKLDDYFVFNDSDKYEFLSDNIRKHKTAVIIPVKHAFPNEELSCLANGVPVLIDSEFNNFIRDTQNDYRDLAEKIMLMLYSDLSKMKEIAKNTAIKISANWNLKFISIIDKAVETLNKSKYDGEIESKL